MRVRDENMPELKLFGDDAIENRLRVKTGVEQRRIARNLVPNQVAIYG